jgi:structure-specific endonuclease subunit SLX1
VCGVCKKEADTSTSIMLVCPIDFCQTVSHLSCLASKFLAEGGDEDALVPIEGTCPGCHSTITWSAMMKELSLRLHGEEELKTMFKPKRKRKSDNISESDTAEMPQLGEDEDLDETWMEDMSQDEDAPQ